MQCYVICLFVSQSCFPTVFVALLSFISLLYILFIFTSVLSVGDINRRNVFVCRVV